MAHKIRNTQHVSSQSESFPLQLVKYLVIDAIHLDCRMRWRLKSLDITHSSARRLTTHRDDVVWCRNWCNTSKQSSLDGWRSFFATRLAKFRFGLDSITVPLAEVTNTLTVVRATIWRHVILAFTDVESPIVPILGKIYTQNQERTKIWNTQNRRCPSFFNLFILPRRQEKLVSLPTKVPLIQLQSLINHVTFESLYSIWFHKKSSNEAIHTLYVTGNKIVVKLFRYCSIMSVYGITNALNALFKRETVEKSVYRRYKVLRKSYQRHGEKHQLKVVLDLCKTIFCQTFK